MIVTHWIAVGLLLATTPVTAQHTQMQSEAVPLVPNDRQGTPDEVSLGRDQGDRMTVAVSVIGKGPYRFLVDTGAERTVISRQLAERLNLSSGKSAILHSVVGANDVQTVFIPHLQVSGNVISVVDAPKLEASNIGADGMLGIDSLRSQRVMFDFKAQTMSITPSDQPVTKMDGDTIVVRAKTRNGRLIFTQAEIDGQPVTVIVDTGSEVSIGNPALQRALQRKHMIRIPDPTVIESVTGEKLTANVAQIRQLSIGGVRLDDLNVAFADAHIFNQLDLNKRPTLLLGMNAMRAFDRISIDFAAKKVRFVLPGTSMRPSYRLAVLAAR